MVEYLNWLFGFDYLILPSFRSTCFYLTLAMVLCAMRVLVFLKFFYLPNAKQEKPSENTQVLFGGIFIFVTAISVAPFSEEIIFRGPILWFVQKSQYFFAFTAFILSTLVFMAGHAFDIIKRSKFIVYSNGFGGVLYGALIMLTGSLWPSIFLHLIWNIFATVGVSIIGEERLAHCAQSLQH